MDNKDLDQVIKLENTVFLDPWSYHSFEKELENQFSYYFVLEKEEEILGYFGFNIILDECEIYTIAVKEKNQGQGIGKVMMDYIITFCKEHKVSVVTLEVREYNFSAMHLYLNYGFKKITRIKGYYRRPVEDGILMKLEL